DLGPTSSTMHFRFNLIIPGRAAGISDETLVDRARVRDLLDALVPRPRGLAEVHTVAQSLSQLVLPESIARMLDRLRDHHVVVDHDRASATIPWELIRVGDWFPAGGAGMSHRLATEICPDD